ncbi:MAG: phosphatidylethanolamine/phosphatidyl-N-methylethanolamine N-methyltransferase [Myxococcota bacterium]
MSASTSVWCAAADAQALPYEDDSFDIVVATFVFCSVPDPIQGLREARRVLRPGGSLILLEHVLSSRWWLRGPMRLIDPLAARLCGAHIARDTVANVRAAGFDDARVKPLMLDLVLQIISGPSAPLPAAPPDR